VIESIARCFWLGRFRLWLKRQARIAPRIEPTTQTLSYPRYRRFCAKLAPECSFGQVRYAIRGLSFRILERFSSRLSQGFTFDCAHACGLRFFARILPDRPIRRNSQARRTFAILPFAVQRRGIPSARSLLWMGLVRGFGFSRLASIALTFLRNLPNAIASPRLGDCCISKCASVQKIKTLCSKATPPIRIHERY
jgi:hypothetical protein